MKRGDSGEAILAVAVLLGACSPSTLRVSCDEPLSQRECDDVAALALENRRDEAAALGDIREIATTLKLRTMD